MRLTRVAADDFMGYEALDLPLEDVSQVAVTGLNNHGKSAILDAVTWGIFGRVGRDIDQRSADALIHRGADLMRVRVEFTTSSGHAVSITREKPRGQTTTLRLEVDGEERRAHTIDETQARIIGLVGLTYDALTAGPFMVQEDASAFMRAAPRERKDLLMRLLALDEYERLHEQAKGIAQQARIELLAAQQRAEDLYHTVSQAEAIEADVKAAESAHAAAVEAQSLAAHRVTTHAAEMAAAKATLTAIVARQEDVERLRKEAVEARQKIATAEQRLEQVAVILAEAEPDIEVPPPPDPLVVEKAKADVADARAAEAIWARAIGSREHWEQTLERAERQLAILPTVPCHGEGQFATCQFLHDVPKPQDILDVRASLERSRAEEARAEKEAARLPTFNRRLDELQTAQHAHDRLASSARERKATWASRRQMAEAAKDGYLASLAGAQDAVARVTAALDQSTSDATAAEDARTALMRASRAWEDAQLAETAARAAVGTAEGPLVAARGRAAVLAEASASLADWERKMKVASEQERIASILAAAWHRDGVPTSIIERALPLIEARANDILGRLPEDLTIALRTQRPTKSGRGMAETLDVLVTVDGWESPYALLSVGARFRVDVALRLALAEILTRRSGERIETLWLDEPLADLDAPGREAAVETLGALADEFALMVIVSHHPDFNDRFGSRIEVRKEGGVSTARMT